MPYDESTLIEELALLAVVLASLAERLDEIVAMMEMDKES